MSKTAQEGVFILLKVIKRHKEKQREGRKDLPKLKTKVMSIQFLGTFVNLLKQRAVELQLHYCHCSKEPKH